jgi:magnesium-transporting ATPase (P-type)
MGRSVHISSLSGMEADNESEEAPPFEDPEIEKLLVKNDPKMTEFWKLLSLCHTVQPEEIEGEVVYQAASPDEKALADAARYLGLSRRVHGDG